AGRGRLELRAAPGATAGAAAPAGGLRRRLDAGGGGGRVRRRRPGGRRRLRAAAGARGQGVGGGRAGGRGGGRPAGWGGAAGRGEEAGYRLLETLRQYGAERLREAGEEAVVRTRHLEWFADFAAGVEQGLRGPEQVAWLARLDQEHDNLRAALAWSQTEPGNA